MEKYQDTKVRGKEIKQAALEILGDCHGANIGRREVGLINGRDAAGFELEKRALPVAVIVAMYVSFPSFSLWIVLNVSYVVLGGR